MLTDTKQTCDATNASFIFTMSSCSGVLQLNGIVPNIRLQLSNPLPLLRHVPWSTTVEAKYSLAACDSQTTSHSDSSIHSVMLIAHLFKGLPLYQ